MWLTCADTGVGLNTANHRLLHNLQPASRSTVPIFPTSKAVLSISQCSGNVVGVPRWSLFSLLSALAIGTLVGTLGSRLRC